MNAEKSWAECEIELACARERDLAKKEGNEEDANYGIACYKSALKAYKSLNEDGHSGYSISITKDILMRLIEGKPLSPIEDDEEMWFNPYGIDPDHGDHKSYQHRRMPSLFKDVYGDGTVKYHDVNRVRCVNINDSNNTWYNGFINKLIHEMFPITMPYYPVGIFTVYVREFLTDKKNGDYDTMGVIYTVKPDGTKIDINRYFKENEHSFDEIDEVEYKEREMVSFRKGLL